MPSPSPSPLPSTSRTGPYDRPKKEKLSRSRSGCLTCRIRRKKCTEQKDNDGSCDACNRLQIECLGYAEKRPSWMQDAGKLEACKREIRCWLAERGKSDRSTDRLSLSKYYGENTMPPKLRPSKLRRQSRMATALAWASEEDELEDDMEIHDDRTPCALSPESDTTLAPIRDPLVNPILVPILSPIRSHQPSSQQQDSPRSTPNQPILSPYRPAGQQDDEEMGSLPSPSLQKASVDIEGQTKDLSPLYLDFGVHEELVGNLVSVWAQKVRSFQSRVADPAYGKELVQIMGRNANVQDVTRSLIALHRFNTGSSPESPAYETKTEKKELDCSQDLAKYHLQQDSKFQRYHQGHGLAAIFGLSYVLFTGGTADWKLFLEVACLFLECQSISILQGGFRVGLEMAVGSFLSDIILGTAKLSHSTAFLAEATIWTDIMASTSLQKAPRLYKYYSHFLASETDSENCRLFLSRIMGCDNRTMLGIAETSVLAEWKEVEMGKGSLDLHRLSDEGRRIESTFLALLSPVQADAFITTSDDSTTSNLPHDRPNATAVFRAAARVYLHTVISGSFPEAKHVANAVDEVIQCFEKIPKTDADRSFVFSLCVTACMARTPTQKDFFMDRFQALKAVDRVGNCHSAQRLVEEVWRRRSLQSPRIPVDWWNVAKDFEGLILLA